MVDNKVLIGVTTGEYARRADFYDYYNMLCMKHPDCMAMFSHDRSPAHGRNIIVEQALQHDCSHVLFIDDDMAFQSNALAQLLSHGKDIVSGLYLSRAYPHQPLIFDIAAEDGSCLNAYLNGDESRLKEIVAAGFGFCLIKIDVFKKMERPWIRLGELNSEEWCDDIGFFNRVRKAGFKAYCDMECLIGHIGTVIVKPVRENGEWFTGYDTSGKGLVTTPQINTKLVHK